MINDNFQYSGDKLKEISFPLGGIGTGCIGLAGNGRLIDWEIFNRPNKGSYNGFSHFALRVERDGAVIDARVLNGDFPPPYTGHFPLGKYNNFGFGVPNASMAGFPHFREVNFTGTFPLAMLDFIDDTFPGQVRLTAFNPFIPLNEDDSGIPAAFFEFEVTNNSNAPLTYMLAGVLTNPLPENQINSHVTDDNLQMLHYTCDLPADAVKYGDMTLATDAGDASWQEYWYRGGWNDAQEVYWHDFTTAGPLCNRQYAPEDAKAGNHGTLATQFKLSPGDSKTIRFIITWNFPNCENYWNPNKETCKCSSGDCAPNTWKNYYATQFANSRASAKYGLQQWDRLLNETRRFTKAMFSSDMPPVALEAISANISILKSPTVLRLEDGTFYGWEGCHPSEGCCEGSCTHVWNYAQALPFLFPRLERSMRDADYENNLFDHGGLPFRIQLPLGRGKGGGRIGIRACADGQFGGIMKVYRDWKICGDTEWLRGLWPALKLVISYAWSPDNIDRWDPDKTGVLWGRQHHTLDMELFGPSSWLTGFYLGALKAGAEMADALGDDATAIEYRDMFTRGKAWVDANLFNGDYYYHKVNLNDKQMLESFDAVNPYWSEEHSEIKYQVGEGCVIDQLLAQWHAELYGLGEIFDIPQTKTALRGLWKNSFVPLMRNAYNPWRIFSLNDEAGLVICSYPPGSKKPVIPVPYTQETMCGFEYAAAIHMINHGMVDEGMTIVAAIRDRFDGEKRNPWNEIECGSNYARSMASYALLNVFSGFEFDIPRQTIGFHPINNTTRAFWSLDSGWGTFQQQKNTITLIILGGEITLKEFTFTTDISINEITVIKRGDNEEKINARYLIEDGKVRVIFDEPLVILYDEVMEITQLTT
jgi:uncharacterized protein (DUF608 family)